MTSWSERRDDKDVVELNRAFVDGVVRSGGTPYVLAIGAPTSVGDVLDVLDGVVLTGGIDVDPGRYGAPRHASVTEVDPDRDAFEIALVHTAISQELPVLGLCRGAQVLNVALGGTLHQHLPEHSDLAHEVRERTDETAHDIDVEAGSLLGELAGGRRRIGVNTIHHQAADAVADGLRVTARAPDGVVEALEDPRRRLLGVQWHPELMIGGDDVHLGLFEWLVGA